MNILGKKVVLRAIEETDLATLHRWANDPEIWYLLGGWHFPSSIEAQKKWFQSLQSDPLNQRFAVDAPELGLIGTANLVEIDWKNNHAFHGMMLGDKDIRGKGYGIDTIMAVMRYAFEELHLERIDGSMIENNQVSLNVYCSKCGWKEEGRLRRWYFRKNRYWDKIVVGITRDDYFALIAENRYWDTP
jgi:RimJ/RimL family protein N-acetyltransferase